MSSQLVWVESPPRPTCNAKRGTYSVVRCELDAGHYANGWPADVHIGRGQTGRWFSWTGPLEVPPRSRVRGFRQCRRPSNKHEVDPIVVDRVVQGDRTVNPTTAELALAIDRLSGFGYTGRAIAERVGVCEETVHRRLRARRRAEAS